MIEKPWIRIDDIGQKYVGDTFKITGTTNLLEGNGLFIQIIPSSSIHFEMMIDPFSFISGFITVQRGEMYNTFSFDVDASTFKPDQYRIIIKSSKVEIIADKNFTVCTS
jgi:hypothetical protein